MQKNISLKLHSLPRPLCEVFSHVIPPSPLPLHLFLFFFLSAFLNASSLSLSLCHFVFPLRPSLTFCVPLSCDLFSTSPYLSLSLDCCIKDCSGLLSGRKQEQDRGDSQTTMTQISFLQIALWRPSSNSKILHLAQVHII